MKVKDSDRVRFAPSLKSQIIKAVLTSSLSYLLLLILLDNLPEGIKNEGMLKSIFDLSEWTRQKAVSVSQGLEETNLALNFIGNIRKLSFQEAKTFQSSGLLHLLAISGGQIVPLANGISSLISYILFYSLFKKIKPQKLTKIIYSIKSIISLILSLSVCAIFGCSGALIRASTLNYMSKIYFIYSQFSVFYKFIPYCTPTTFNRFMIIIFVTFSFGNVFLNYSFLLSAIGAACTELANYISNHFINKTKILEIISTTVLTSILVGIILCPFSDNNILNSCLANIAALPVVCFLVTPFSLLVLFLPEQSFLFPYILNILDYSLFLLKKIALSFYDPYNKLNPFDKTNPLFNIEGLIYLNVVLLILWISLDIYKERRVFIMRKKILQL